MATRLNPASIRPIPPAFQGIYAHAVEVPNPERFLFVSGQIGTNPDGSTPVAFADQCERAMANVEAMLAAAGMTMADVLRVVYYVTDPDDLAHLRQARQMRWSSDAPPAITTLVVAALASPHLLIEIEVTAAK